MPPLQLTGIVTKAGYMNKTVTVTVKRWIEHSKTGKRVPRHKKYLTHDEANQLRQDDKVTIKHCRPLSARKRFTLEKVLESPEGRRKEAIRRSPVLEAVRKEDVLGWSVKPTETTTHSS
ncbi:hypothetical protein PLICRDRAFT_171516 [Plicaturopsis crispa FD-325 SS-3]|nr:hypothetical protein PLICRDRAFT_171516 [Plicaturopsis crispa FD-325 SS-3]